MLGVAIVVGQVRCDNLIPRDRTVVSALGDTARMTSVQIEIVNAEFFCQRDDATFFCVFGIYSSNNSKISHG